MEANNLIKKILSRLYLEVAERKDTGEPIEMNLAITGGTEVRESLMLEIKTILADVYNFNIVDGVDIEPKKQTLREYIKDMPEGTEITVHDKTYDSEFYFSTRNGVDDHYYTFEDIMLECEVIDRSGSIVTIDMWGAMQKAMPKLKMYALENWLPALMDYVENEETWFEEIEKIITYGYEEYGRKVHVMLFGKEE